MEQDAGQNNTHSAIASLAIMLRILNKPGSPADLQHRLGKHDGINADDILFLAQEHLGLRAKRKKVPVERLARQPLPAIVEFGDGSFHVLGKVDDTGCLIQNTRSGQAERLSREEFAGLYGGGIILLAPGFGDESEDHRDFGFSWFFQAFLRERDVLVHVIVAALVIQVFALATPMFTMVIIDKVLSSSGVSTLEVLIFGLVLIAIFDLVLSMFRRQLLHHASNKVDVQLVARLFRHLTRLPMTFFTAKRTGDTISRMKEVESIRSFLTGTALTAIIDAPFSIVFLVVMYMFNPLLTGIVILAVVASFALYGFVSPALKARVQKKHNFSADSQSFLIEAVHNIETVKALSVEPQMHRQWEHQLAAQTHYSSDAENLSGNVAQVAGFINKGTVAICLWVGAMAVLDGHMTSGQLVAFNMLVGRVMAPTQRIAQMLQQLQQIRVSLARVAEIFKVAAEPALHTDQSVLPVLKGHITLQNVSFRYGADSPNVLEDIDLEIPQGQIVGIVGRSGAGKSTFARLVQRLYVPSKGRILVDGINIAEVDPSWLRRSIGVVPQEARLLNRSIRENIAIADPSATMERIEAVATMAGADDFIRALPKAYDTIVGEGGALLSAGQRQRIAIARALLNDPKILIFDEATSSLDYESEQQVQENMRQICRGRTVILVAHRLSTLRIADRILTLENGLVAEDGSPSDLLKSDGRFAQLYALHSVAG